MTMTFSEKLKSGKPAFGTMIRMIRSPGIACICKAAGFDMMMLDMEHGPFSYETVSDIAVTAQAEGIGILVRVPELSKGTISRALDCGVQGVMVPMLSTPDEARKLVEWSKYPPLGKRGLGSVGGLSRYTIPVLPAAQHMHEINQQVFSIAQIETVEGVRNAAEIAAIDGIDALVVGPNDLANSLGCPGDLTCAKEEQAIAAISKAARDAGKSFGIHAGTSILERWADHGMTFFLNSIDIIALTQAFTELNKTTRALRRE